MTYAADFNIVGEGAGATIRLTGRLTLARLGGIYDRLHEALLAHGPVAQIDLSGVERIDTVGAWLVRRVVEMTNGRVVGASQEALILMDAVGRAEQPVQMTPDRVPPWIRVISQIGLSVRYTAHELKGILAFLGEALISSFALLRDPRRIRWHAVITRFETVGVNALAIIGLMTFLIGIVIAQQGATQLAQFGFDIYTINLVGRVSVRELGLLMTAIMVAGRSGSAFAAQIGTMKLTEEIDAMRTIGVSPMEALVLPRVMATVMMMPLLGFYAAMCAIFGGGIFCWIGLGIPPGTYIERMREILPMTDVWVMLIKAPVFGIIVAITGCYEGMQVKANAEEVGQRTTAAVVQGIFLVIVLDAFFAVFFTAIGWG